MYHNDDVRADRSASAPLAQYTSFPTEKNNNNNKWISFSVVRVTFSS